MVNLLTISASRSKELTIADNEQSKYKKSLLDCLRQGLMDKFDLPKKKIYIDKFKKFNSSN